MDSAAVQCSNVDATPATRGSTASSRNAGKKQTPRGARARTPAVRTAAAESARASERSSSARRPTNSAAGGPCTAARVNDLPTLASEASIRPRPPTAVRLARGLRQLRAAAPRSDRRQLRPCTAPPGREVRRPQRPPQGGPPPKAGRGSPVGGVAEAQRIRVRGASEGPPARRRTRGAPLARRRQQGRARCRRAPSPRPQAGQPPTPLMPDRDAQVRGLCGEPPTSRRGRPGGEDRRAEDRPQPACPGVMCARRRGPGDRSTRGPEAQVRPHRRGRLGRTSSRAGPEPGELPNPVPMRIPSTGSIASNRAEARGPASSARTARRWSA